MRPLEPLPLDELQRVKVTISEVAVGFQRDLDVVERARVEVAVLHSIPTIEEVRAASIPGSFAEEVIAERGDY